MRVNSNGTGEKVESKVKCCRIKKVENGKVEWVRKLPGVDFINIWAQHLLTQEMLFSAHKFGE